MSLTNDADQFCIAFGQAVRRSRQRAGLSQEDMGFEAELDRTYISGVERGVRNPTLKIIFRIARALQVKPSTLIQRAEQS